jgi:hypothetical protein
MFKIAICIRDAVVFLLLNSSTNSNNLAVSSSFNIILKIKDALRLSSVPNQLVSIFASDSSLKPKTSLIEKENTFDFF